MAQPEQEVWRDPRNVDRLIEMLRQGTSQSEMARQLNCSRSAIHGKLDRLGLTPLEFQALPPPQPKAQPLRPGATTLPPLPSLLMPFPKIGRTS